MTMSLGKSLRRLRRQPRKIPTKSSKPVIAPTTIPAMVPVDNDEDERLEPAESGDLVVMAALLLV